MSDEGCLPVVVDVAVGDGHEVCCMGELFQVSIGISCEDLRSVRGRRPYIKETVIVVFVMRLIRRDINVVKPDVAGLLDTDRITIGSEDLGDGNIADDDVLRALNEQTKAGEDDLG